MQTSQIVFGSVMVVALLAIAGTFGWAQRAALLRARALPDEERRFERRRAVRRLVGCALLAVIAVLFVLQLVFWEAHAGAIAAARAAMGPDAPPPDEEIKPFLRLWAGAWIALLLCLLLVLILTALDLFEGRSQALKAYKKLRHERRAMIERQAARLREERDGGGEVPG